MESFKLAKGNQNPEIEEEQTTQWSKEKGQKDKQQSTKHYPPFIFICSNILVAPAYIVYISQLRR